MSEKTNMKCDRHHIYSPGIGATVKCNREISHSVSVNSVVIEIRITLQSVLVSAQPKSI